MVLVGKKVRLPTLPVVWILVERKERYSPGFLSSGRWLQA